MTRIQDKIVEIEKYLKELQEFVPKKFKDYAYDYKTRAACERYFEKITEALIDLALLFIKEYDLLDQKKTKTHLIYLHNTE
jgi:uncharacterized protein YutE (UPF0331/DUF86 family)